MTLPLFMQAATGTQTPQHLRIATRQSQLALWQADWVKRRLESLGHSAELVRIETLGDQTQAANKPFAQLAGQGFFTKAVQDAVLAGRADMAVHSYKDLPSLMPTGLEIAAITERADARDVLLLRPEVFEDHPTALPLKRAAVVGTSAIRRRQQLEKVRPDLKVAELRGNVPTRIEKLRAGDYDAVVLAAAGLERLALDLSDLAVVTLEPSVMMPAPAQGALALETRRDAYTVAAILTALHHNETYKAVAAERGLMALLDGGCQLALGAYARLAAGQVRLAAWYDGKMVEVQDPSAENAALLAFDALGRPTVTGSGA